MDETEDTSQNQKFNFNAVIDVKENWVDDVNIQGHASRYKATLCYLIIDRTSDQGVSFMSDWLPDLTLEPGKQADHNTRSEVAMILGSPISGPCRGAVMRANHLCSEHHIQIMSLGVEEEIIRRKLNKKKISVTVLPAKDENTADMAKGSGSEIHG